MMISAVGFLLRYWRPLALAATLLASHGYAYTRGASGVRVLWAAQTAQDRAVRAEGDSRLVRSLRASERAATARAEALAGRLETDRKEYTRATARVRDDVLGMRLRGTCAAPAVPEGSAGDPGSPAAAGACELPPGTTAGLVGLAVRADDLALKYNTLLEFTSGLTCGVQHDVETEEAPGDMRSGLEHRARGSGDPGP